MQMGDKAELADKSWNDRIVYGVTGNEESFHTTVLVTDAGLKTVAVKMTNTLMRLLIGWVLGVEPWWYTTLDLKAKFMQGPVE